MKHSWLLRLLLLDPDRIQRSLDRVRDAQLIGRVPNLWQIALGVLRMQHRVLFRADTVGTCRSNVVRPTWRARALQFRPIRFPFLLSERAIAPLDMSGLLSSEERVIRHLLGAHHDGNQFAYDLQMLAAHPGALERLHASVREVVIIDSPRSRWLRDLCVFEGYHESLLAAVERALHSDFGVAPDEENDPDITFFAYLRWCASQPTTPEEMFTLLRNGSYSVERGASTC